MAGLKEDNMTDNQDTHISKLDDLFDQACEYLSDLPSSAYEPQFIQMSLDIIDRWLAVREQDRQYELKISPINDTRNTEDLERSKQPKEIVCGIDQRSQKE